MGSVIIPMSSMQKLRQGKLPCARCTARGAGSPSHAIWLQSLALHRDVGCFSVARGVSSPAAPAPKCLAQSHCLESFYWLHRGLGRFCEGHCGTQCGEGMSSGGPARCDPQSPLGVSPLSHLCRIDGATIRWPLGQLVASETVGNMVPRLIWPLFPHL